MKNGIYTMAAEEYHRDPCDVPSLSASIAHVICSQSPLHAWAKHSRLNPDFKREEQAGWDIGTCAHALLLEGAAAVDVIEAPDWRSKGAQLARENARAEGRIALLAKHYDGVQAMVGAAKIQLSNLDIDPQPFTDGKPEQTLVWEEDGATCRARLDWLRDDRATIDDYKSTKGSANPEAWTRTLYQIGADIQAAMYLRGLAAVNMDGLSLYDQPEFRFIVQETYAPYALSVVSLGPAALEIANRKVEYAIRTWRECLEKGEWPGYSSQVCVADLPPWEENRWLEKEEREEFDYGEGCTF
jgi:hypothetical protein